MSSFDPITMATQLATFDIQPFEIRYQAQASKYQGQLDALNAVESALKAFQSAINGMNSSTESIIKNSATLSQDNHLTASADNTAIAGSYELFVEQLASNHQIVTGMPDNLTADKVIPSKGEMVLGVAGETFTVDFATLETNDNGEPTIQSLVKAINEHPDNSGVNATLIRSNGQTDLVLTSEKSGASNGLTAKVENIETNAGWFWLRDAFSPANMTALSEPQDAVVRLGGENGLKITSETNTFSNAIDGVSFTATKINQSGEAGTTMTIASDKAGTKDSINEFIEAYNTLLDQLDEHTAIGNESSQRGVLANDPTIRSIESQLGNILRQSFDGISLYEIGITTKRDGRLELDSSRFDAAQSTRSSEIEALFNGENQLFDSIDTIIEPFVKISSGLFDSRTDNLEKNLDRIEAQQAGLEKKYETAYNRYLAQYTQMNNIINQMNSTMGLFGTPEGMF